MRIPLGSALPVLALGLAASFVAPSLFGGGFDGEPIRMAAATSRPNVQLANFEGEACATALTHGADADARGVRIVAVTLGSDGERMTVELDEVPADALSPDATLVLLLDAEGRLIAAGDAEALSEESARTTLATDCHEAEQVHGAI